MLMINTPRSNPAGIKQKSSFVRWLQFSTRSLLLAMVFTGVGGTVEKYRRDAQQAEQARIAREQEQRAIDQASEIFEDAMKLAGKPDEYSITPKEYAGSIVKIENIPSKK